MALPIQLKPEIEIDTFKTGFLVEEAIAKLQFLSKINKKEDNSSELAGFEINKLLKEQARLEELYAELIKRRSRLKGIALRDQHKAVELEIDQKSKMLKESTKKLCRLFKENTNLDGDATKVKEERMELFTTLGNLLKCLSSNDMTEITNHVVESLESQNKLQDNLREEHELKDAIKELNHQISLENKDKKELIQRMQKNIQTLRDEKRRHETSTKMQYDYKEKVMETKIATVKRIYQQDCTNIKRERDHIIELKARENEVFKKISKYLDKENARLSVERDNWEEKKNVKLLEISKHQREVTNKILVAKERLQRLEKGLADEKQEAIDFEEQIMKKIRANEEKNEHQKKVDQRMMLVQKTFEEWLKANGGPKKKKKRGKK